MSIKIYNGRRRKIAGLADVLRWQADLRQMRGDLTLKAERHYRSVLFETALRLKDRVLLGLEAHPEQGVIRKARENFPKGEDRESRVLWVLQGDQILALIYAGRDFSGKIEAGLSLEDYHYQDQTDRDEEDISEAEWGLRLADWEEALGPSWIPSVEMHLTELAPKCIPDLIALSEEHDVPDFALRCRRHAIDQKLAAQTSLTDWSAVLRELRRIEALPLVDECAAIAEKLEPHPTWKYLQT